MKTVVYSAMGRFLHSLYSRDRTSPGERAGLLLPALGRCAAAILLLCSPLCGSAPAGLWLRGQLHAHSQYSDGDEPAAFVLADAERLGLDFFALTDHDSLQGGIPRQWSGAEYASATMILLYGMEWTTDRGDANIWAAAPFDYDPLWGANLAQDPDAAARAIHEQGGLFSLNHPMEILGSPWLYPAPVEADCIEVWNSMFILQSGSFLTVSMLWDSLLRQGRHVTGVGGSDKASYRGWWSYFYSLDMPTDWVWAEERSAAAIIDGIKRGHVSISYSADSPRLELAADADGDGQFETMMGDTAHLGSGALLRMKLTVAGAEANAAYLACVYKNGVLCRAVPILGPASVQFGSFALKGDYFRAELKGMTKTPLPLRPLYGYMVALTNPVYVGQ